MQEKRRGQQRNIVKKALFSAAISFVLITALYHLILQHNMAADKERYAYIARNQAERIITAIDCVMSRTSTLKILVVEHGGDTSWFDDVAEDLYMTVKYETGVSPKNFAMAPDGVVSDVYPLEGNEALLGFDFLDTSREGNFEAEKAYEEGHTILTNPFELVQGGIGMGGRSPVVIQNGDSTYLWGLVTVTIDFDNLMEVVGLDNLKGMGVDYSLSYIDTDGSAKFMYGTEDLGKNTVKTQFNVRNLTWELEVMPRRGWFSEGDVIFSLAIILILSGFAGLLTYMMFRLQESNTLLLRLSTTDVMTGCYNRRAYEDRIHELYADKIDEDFVYVSADINGLKQTNDTLGHAAGDELISGTTQCLQEAFGKYGVIYRIGGDEFTALISANEETLDKLMENLKSIIDGWRGHSVNTLSMSIGYASHREFPDMSIEELGKAADKKMYEEKQKYYQTHDRRRRI